MSEENKDTLQDELVENVEVIDEEQLEEGAESKGEVDKNADKTEDGEKAADETVSNINSLSLQSNQSQKLNQAQKRKSLKTSSKKILTHW